MLIDFSAPSKIRVADHPRLLDWRRNLGIKVPGGEYSKAFQRGQWDGFQYPGYRCTAVPLTLYAYAGLYPRICADFHQPVAWPNPPLLPKFEDLPEELYDYQREAFWLIARERWGRFAHATNAGKGAVIALFSDAAARGGLATLILCDEIAVYEALAGELARWAPLAPIGHVRGGSDPQPPMEGNIFLAMVPTLARRLKGPFGGVWRKWLLQFQVLLADEADKASAETWQRVLQRAENTYWRVGFSGSFPDPDTLEDRILEETIGPILDQVKNLELVDRGISARPEITLHALNARLPRHRPDNWTELAGTEQRRWIYEQTMLSDRRINLIRTLIQPEAINVIVVRRILHGNMLSDAFGCPFINGATSPSERNRVLAGLEAGDVKVLVTSSILDRGTNKLGWATNLIFASGEGSDRQTLQRIGRGLRRSGGKEYVQVHDIVDLGHRYLNNAVKQRVRLYESEGFIARLEFHG